MSTVTEALTPSAVDRRRKTMTLVVVSSALFLALLDSTVITLALPTIGKDLGAGLSGLQWIIDGYILCYASLLLAGGALGDRMGRRRVFMIGMLIFAVGSAGCALAGTAAALIAGRAVQGLGAAAITPQTLAILSETFPEPAERARAFGVWSGVSGLALVLGPLVGGTLVQVFGWQSVFLLNIPVCLTALAIASRLPDSDGGRGDQPLHPLALLLTLSWLGSLTYLLVEGKRLGWGSPAAIGLLALACGSLLVLVVTQGRSSRPALRLSLFGRRTFTGAVAVAFLIAFGLTAVFLFLSLLLQRVEQLSPAAAGNRVLPAMAAIVVAALLGGRVAARFGSRLPVACGCALAGTSLVLLGVLVVGHGYGTWWPLLVTFGFGVGMVMSPNNAALMGSVPAGLAGQGSALNSVSQQVGALVGIAVLGALVNETAGLAQGDLANSALQSSALQNSALENGIRSGILVAGGCYLLAAVIAVGTLGRPGTARRPSANSSSAS